jgi:tetratricopeptide (TPR) repeat protein
MPSIRPSIAAALLLALAACHQASYEEKLEEARAMQEAGQAWESIEPLRKLLDEKPGDAEASYLLGSALAGTGQPSLAIIPLLRAADDDEYAVPAGLLLASTQLGLQNYEESERAATKVLEREARNKRALLVRYEARVGAGRVEDGLKDAEQVLEIEPGGYEGLMAKATALVQLKQLDEAEQVYRSMADTYAKEQSERGVRSCVALGALYGERKEVAKAKAQLDHCLGTHTGPLAVQLSSQLLAWLGERERALEVLRGGVEGNPDQPELRVALAKSLADAGKLDEADVVLLEAAKTFENPPAWMQLASFRRQRRQLSEARDALQRAIELSADDNEDLRFQLADLQLDLGELDAAETTAKALKEPAYRDHIEGRLLVERGQNEQAIPVLERSLSQWPNNAGARYAAARAAFQLGRYDEARAQLLEAHRLDAKGNDAALLIARLHLIEGNYAQAGWFAQRHLQFRGATGTEPFLIGARAAAGQGRFEDAQVILDKMRETKAFEGVAVGEQARLKAGSAGAKAGVAVIEQSKVDVTAPDEGELLQTYVRLLLESGQAAKALETAKRAVAVQPDSAEAEALVGTLVLELGKLEDAKAAFDRATALDPKSAAALGGLGRLEVANGRVPEALALFERAAEAAPGAPTWRFEAARTRLAGSEREAGKQALQELLNEFPDFAPAANDLAWALAEENEELDQALRLAVRAVRLSPEAEVLDTLGFVRLQRGELDEAEDAFRTAVERSPDFATGRYHLGLTLARMGDVEGAGEALRAALDGGAFPEAEQARAELARLGETGGAEARP